MTLAEVVDYLKRPPFSMRLTQVTLDEKTPIQLLQLLNDVMAKLSLDMDMDIRNEQLEQTSFRMVEFLSRVLTYKYQQGTCVLFV
jgi:hypothetical protein